MRKPSTGTAGFEREAEMTPAGGNRRSSTAVAEPVPEGDAIGIEGDSLENLEDAVQGSRAPI